ncbi:MAG: hypothetical protein R3B45_07645 [Bdellovibrionota bacterium]
MQKVLSFLLGLIAICGISNGQELRTYTLPSYPADAENCEDIAGTWGQKLATDFGVSIFQTECKRPYSSGYGGYDINISFTSRVPLPRETNINDLLYGSYRGEDACNADLNYQVDLFQSQTGLEAYAAYCSPEGYLFLRAFGESPIKRRLFNSHFAGEYSFGDIWIEDPDQVRSDIFDAVSNLGVTVSELHIRTGRVYLYYYARERLNLQATYFTSYANEEDCESEKPRVSQTIATFDGNAIFQMCASTDSFPVPQKSMFSLVSMPYPFFWPQIYQLYLEDVPGTYPNLNECLTNRPNVERFYEQSLQREVYQSLCSYREDEPRKYMIKIFRSV